MIYTEGLGGLPGILYLQKASFGGDHQDIRVAFILHGQELICWWTVGPELERRAGSPDLPFVSYITELVELSIVIGHIISCWKEKIILDPQPNVD